MASICHHSTTQHGFETQTRPYSPTGLTRNRSAIQFFKLIKLKIWLLLETAWVVVKPHRFLNRSWVYGLVTYFLQIFSKKKKKKELVIYLLVITGSLNCQSRLLTNLTPFLYCKQLTIARSWFWSKGSLTLVVMFIVKKKY